MNLLLLAATSQEIAPLQNWLEARKDTVDSEGIYRIGGLAVTPRLTGVGLPLTAFRLGSLLADTRYQLVVQLGIGGALDPSLTIGDVVEISHDRFADLGAETGDGSFLDLGELGLRETDSGIIDADGWIVNPYTEANPSGLPACRGISVNRVHGSTESIRQLRARLPSAQIESMEGAAFFYACRYHQCPMLQIRAVSNYVEARNRDNWNIPLAVERLNATGQRLLEAFLT